MVKLRWIVFGVLVLFVVSLASTTASQLTQAQQPKIYTMGMLSDLRTTNTMRTIRTASVWEAYVLGPRHCSLFGLSPTRFYYIPSLAASVPYKPGTTELNLQKEGDLFTLVVDLKKGVTWSDGTEVTADDVVFSMYEGPKLFGGGDFVKGVTTLGGAWTVLLDPNVLEKVEKTGSHQVKLFFKQANLRIQWAILFADIFQKKYWEPKFNETKGDRAKLEALEVNDEPACGWGAMPEALKAPGVGWQRGAFATNVANPNYFWKGVKVDERDAQGNYSEEKPGVYTYKQPVPAAAGPELARYETGPFIDRASYRIFADTSSAVAALIKGEIDMLLNPLGADPGIRAQYRSEPKIKTQDNKSHGMFYQSFNLRRKPFGSGPLQKDPKFRDDDIIGSRFRQAWNCLIDRDFTTQTLFQRVAFSLQTVVSPANSFWFNEKLRAPCDEFSEQTDKTAARAKKVARAVEILKSVGFTWVKEPTANTTTGAVTAGEGIILPVILSSVDAKAGQAVSVPSGAIAVGAKVKLDDAAKAELTVGATKVKSDAAGKISAALGGATSVTLNVDGKLYFYGAGDKTKDRMPTANFIYPNSAYDPRRALFGVQTEKWVNQIGIPVRGVPTGFNVIVTKVFDEQDFDVWSLGWSLGGLTPPDYLESFFHTRHTELGDDNPQGYSNPDVDAMLDEFLKTLDLNKARDLVFKIQEILLVESPYVPLFDTAIVDAWRDDKVVYPFVERTQGIVGMGGMPALVKLR
uniref:Extracellular solute-binding protein n=2 Tax=Candidatus Bipolaricaulota TaxID=67810 RepID=H5SMP1_9BACT|nr:extracellular solute-binding protein [uncultured Acetothermia bacterium]BAL59809.1 extracellular solute-binding protein [Candidatus Acetothermum autotrophicum]